MSRGISILLAAFGSTRAIDTYSIMLEEARSRFPGSSVSLVFSSRIIRNSQPANLLSPREAVNNIAEQGNGHWAVVQSVHLLCGHEFYRLVDEVKNGPIRTSIGLPLLWSKRDYEEVARILINRFKGMAQDREAVVFIGHGTDHASWSTYPALEHLLVKMGFKNAFVGVVDGVPGPEDVLSEIIKAGFSRALFIPFMLVSGLHVREDIKGDQKDSWTSIFHDAGITARVFEKGLLEIKGIRRIFYEHLADAMDVIPGTVEKRYKI